MNKKDKKIFDELNKKLLIQLLNKENKKIPVMEYVPKMIYSGFGLFTDDMVQKCKLLPEHEFNFVRKERFLLNLGKTSKKGV